MLQDWTYIVPYFAATPFLVIEGNDLFLFIGYIFFSLVVVLSTLKVIYDINLKFQIVVHTLSLLHEFINIALTIFLTL